MSVVNGMFGREGLATGRRRLVGLLAVAVAIAVALVWGPASAWALAGPGHVYGGTFGTAGSGAGELDGPSGVAVDEASGDVYVVDAGNERVEVFAPNGSGGYAYASEFKVRSPNGAIAVDNSTAGTDATRGDVYVVGSKEKDAELEEHEVIYEYSPVAKEVVHKWTTVKGELEGETEELELEDISGVSVDAQGRLWVYWEEEGVIDAFSKQASKNGVGSRLVWEPALERFPEIEFRFECSARPGFAVAPEADVFYSGYERESESGECPGSYGEPAEPAQVAKLDSSQPTPRVLSRELVAGPASGVAVDPASGDVYLDRGSSISALTSAGAPIQRFGQGHLTGAEGMAVDGEDGRVFAPEPEADRVVVFDPEETAGAPVVDGVSSRDLSPTSAEVSAWIDPHGLESEYRFQYGTAECASNPCQELPLGKIPAGFGDREVHAVLDSLSPATAYFYRVVASNAAGSVVGAPSPNTFTTLPSPGVMPDGRGWELVSPASKKGGAVEVISGSRGGSIQAAADGDAITWLATGPILGETVGNRSLEFTQLLSRREAGGWQTTSLETSHEEGRGLNLPSPSEYHYFSPDLSQALLQPTEPFGSQERPPLAANATEKTMYVRSTPPAPAGFQAMVTAENDTAGNGFGGKLEFRDATSDLRHVIFESTVGLTAAAPQAAGLYEWEAGGAPLQLVSVLPDGAPAPDEGNEATPVLGDGGGLNVRGALSEDGGMVFWSEEHQQVPRELYLRDSERAETIEVNEAQGQGATEPGPQGEILEEPEEEDREVHFQGASADGRRVFFTDTARLSEDSTLEPRGEEPPEDLYEFELTNGPGEPLKGRLSDLTAESAVGRADVLNLLPGLSTDGSRVFFVANGVLAPGATPGECPRNPEQEEESPSPGATCNLYVSEPNPADPQERLTRFITALSAQDAADWGAGETTNLLPLHGNLSITTARLSPNGRYLAFMSDRSLTGYDNHDLASGEADEEVYLYDAETGRLSCASCNSTGSGEEWQQPEGVFDTEHAGEGVGLLVDRPEIWRERWLGASIPGWDFNFSAARPSALYQPRYLTDNGRLYFDSSDALVPADTNHREDVYQYEPLGVGSCESSGGCVGLISSGSGDSSSTFLDASETGNDVFFLTADELVPTDTDNSYDIYDAHVCEPASPCIQTHVEPIDECTGTSSCHEPAQTTPAAGEAPASATFNGPGNSAEHAVQASKATDKPKPKAKPLTKAQKLRKALAQCHKLRRRHKRQTCEKHAREVYAPKRKSAHAKTKNAHVKTRNARAKKGGR